MNRSTLFWPDSKNYGGNHMIMTQMERHQKAIKSSSADIKITRPHSHVDYKKSYYQKLNKLKLFDTFSEVSKTFKGIKSIKKGSVDTSTPKSFMKSKYLFPQKNYNLLPSSEHKNNVRSLIRRIEEIEVHGNTSIKPVRPKSSKPVKPLESLPGNFNCQNSLEIDLNRFRIKKSHSYLKEVKKEWSTLDPIEVENLTNSKSYQASNKEKVLEMYSDSIFLSEVRDLIDNSNGNTKFIILKKQLYKFIVENRILGEKDIERLENATIKEFPDINSKQIHDFFGELIAFISKPLNKF